jgi:hypothetical protein
MYICPNLLHCHPYCSVLSCISMVDDNEIKQGSNTISTWLISQNPNMIKYKQELNPILNQNYYNNYTNSLSSPSPPWICRRFWHASTTRTTGLRNRLWQMWWRLSRWLNTWHCLGHIHFLPLLQFCMWCHYKLSCKCVGGGGQRMTRPWAQSVLVFGGFGLTFGCCWSSLSSGWQYLLPPLCPSIPFAFSDGCI